MKEGDGNGKDFVSSGCRVELKRSGRSFTTAFSDALNDLMTRDEKVVACTAAMPDGTGIVQVQNNFPQRTWDTGICESHAMDMMAGLAKTGHKPFFAVYSTFLQRAFDQVFQEVALQGLAVRLCLDRAGCVGGDGAVHQGFCDIAMLSVFPKACLIAALDESSLKAGLDFLSEYEDGVSAIRYPRDNVSELAEQRFGASPPFELGKARPLVTNEKPDAAILAYGTCGIDAIEAIDMLNGEYSVDLYDARFAMPVDEALIHRLIESGTPIITVEDHAVHGGFGANVIDACNRAGLDASKIIRLGMPHDGSDRARVRSNSRRSASMPPRSPGTSGSSSTSTPAKPRSTGPAPPHRTSKQPRSARAEATPVQSRGIPVTPAPIGRRSPALSA